MSLGLEVRSFSLLELAGKELRGSLSRNHGITDGSPMAGVT